MSQDHKPDPEVQPKPTRRTFSAAYKRRILAEADACQHGELGALLRREGLTYALVSKWRKAQAAGTLDTKKRGPVANPKRGEMQCQVTAEREPPIYSQGEPPKRRLLPEELAYVVMGTSGSAWSVTRLRAR